jgi:hypothetical protein
MRSSASRLWSPSKSGCELTSGPSPEYGQLVAGAGPVGALDDAADRQVEGLREGEVALVVAGHRHDRARPVLHQHVVATYMGRDSPLTGLTTCRPRKTPVLGLSTEPRCSASSVRAWLAYALTAPPVRSRRRGARGPGARAP